MRWYAALGLALQLALTGWLGWLGLRLETDNRIERFAVRGHTEESAFRQFSTWFPDREWVLVSQQLAPEETGFDRAEARLAKLAKAAEVLSTLSLGTMRSPLGKVPDNARLAFPFWQPDSRFYSGVLVLDPAVDREAAVNALRSAAAAINEEAGGTRVHLAGEPLVNEALNRGADQVRFRFFPLLIAFALILLGILFRRLSVLAIVSLSVTSSLCTIMGLLALRGEPLNLVTTLVPALVFVLAVAMQIHVLMGIALRGQIGAGVRCKLRANFLVSLTTSIGFASLATSHVAPIAELGLAMAAGIWIAFLWTHLTYATLGVLWPPQPKPPAMIGIGHLVGRAAYWRLIARPIGLLVPVAVIAGGVLVLLGNPRESNALAYFPPDHEIRAMTAFVEDNVTGAAQLELLLTRPENHGDSGPYLPEPDTVANLTAALTEVAGVRHALDLYGMVRPFLPPGADGDMLRTAAGLAGTGQPLAADYLHPRAYRITLLVDTMDQPRYLRLRADIDRLTNGLALPSPVMITGPLDRVMAIQSYLLSTLALSLGLTIALVMLLIIAALRRWQLLPAILIANMFPLGMMALAMPVFGIPTTISTVMVFSVAFGIAVDDSIHLLHTCRERHPSFEAAWRLALSQDLRAVWLTTIALSGGFLMLTTASFLPTRDFGILLVTGLLSALFGDLLFLPAMLRYVYQPASEPCEPVA